MSSFFRTQEQHIFFSFLSQSLKVTIWPLWGWKWFLNKLGAKIKDWFSFIKIWPPIHEPDHEKSSAVLKRSNIKDWSKFRAIRMNGLQNQRILKTKNPKKKNDTGARLILEFSFQCAMSSQRKNSIMNDLNAIVNHYISFWKIKMHLVRLQKKKLQKFSSCLCAVQSVLRLFMALCNEHSKPSKTLNN